jgi:sugar transferase EpsL
MKRLFDILVAGVVLILFSGLLVLLSLFIKIKLGSPVIFKQRRPGLNGQSFTLYKFRTMTNSDGGVTSDAERYEFSRTTPFINRISRFIH